MKNESGKIFKETGKKRDRLAFLRGLAITTALVLALATGLAGCGAKANPASDFKVELDGGGVVITKYTGPGSGKTVGKAVIPAKIGENPLPVSGKRPLSIVRASQALLSQTA
ncbi:MAG: hypothetical protein MdMp014T_0550 [Treponematales bacterium]